MSSPSASPSRRPALPSHLGPLLRGACLLGLASLPMSCAPGPETPASAAQVQAAADPLGDAADRQRGRGHHGDDCDEHRRYDPVPSIARGPAIPASGYLVREIRDGVYWVTDGNYNAMFLTTGSGVILVDAPPTIGAKLANAIRDVTSEPVTHLVYSHHHRDHIGSASLFPGATIIAHKETEALLRRAADPARPVPTVTFADSYTLRVGSQTLRLDYRGNNHDPGNLFIYAPRQKVLMLVDIIFPGWVPFKYLAVSQDITGYIEAHSQALGYDFRTLVGGHLTRLGTRQDVVRQLDYINDIKANAGRALATVDFVRATAGADPANPWQVFELFLGAVADQCARDTLVKWRGQLGAADLWTRSHCWTMQESLRID